MDEDAAGIAGGTATGAASGALAGAQIGAMGGPAAAITVPIGALIGAIFGGAGGGLSAHATQRNQELSRYGGGAAPPQCPAGFTYDAASNSCVPTAAGAADNLSSIAKNLENEEGENILAQTVKKLFQKKAKNMTPVELNEVVTFGGTPLDVTSEPI